MKTDYVTQIYELCLKREEILMHGRSMREYNKYYDLIRQFARCLIREGHGDKLLSYLDKSSVSVKFDIAGILYNSYPEICHKVLKDISEMTVETGLPKQLIMLSVAAYDNLKYGIPKDFP